jgi:hypothetical protein
MSRFVVFLREEENGDVWNTTTNSKPRVAISNLIPSKKYQVRVVGVNGNTPYGSNSFAFITNSCKYRKKTKN